MKKKKINLQILSRLKRHPTPYISLKLQGNQIYDIDADLAICNCNACKAYQILKKTTTNKQIFYLKHNMLGFAIYNDSLLLCTQALPFITLVLWCFLKSVINEVIVSVLCMVVLTESLVL